MKALFYLLIFGRLPCHHEYEIMHKGATTRENTEIKIGGWYDCRCKKCGSIKCFKV